MKDRNTRDAERRNYINKSILENLKLTEDDPESLFADNGEKINEE